MGFKFNGDKQGRKFELLETELLLKILKRIDLLINVGANIGYYVCIAAHSGKRVVAFEPLPQNVKFLLRNVKKSIGRILLRFTQLP